MKKLLCLVFILFLNLPVFAEYKPIPKELSQQYKVEIETYINKQSFRTKNKIEQQLFRACLIYLYQGINNLFLGKNYNKVNDIEYQNEQSRQIFEFSREMDNLISKYYKGLIEITNKYVDIYDDVKYFYYPFEYDYFLSKYLFDNQIKNISKIDSVYNYNEFAQDKILDISHYASCRYRLIKECRREKMPVYEVQTFLNKKFLMPTYENFEILYDLSSFNYDKKLDKYTVDVFFDNCDICEGCLIKCPFGKGDIKDLIYSTEYIPSKKEFNAKYKGFTCMEQVYEYKNGELISAKDEYTGIYYNNDTSLNPDYKTIYFHLAKKKINKPDKSNYFGIVKMIKKINKSIK